LVMQGVDLRTVQELMGHQSDSDDLPLCALRTYALARGG
jgi:hypothetical protein